jgi:hypothetical protein
MSTLPPPQPKKKHFIVDAQAPMDLLSKLKQNPQAHT